MSWFNPHAKKQPQEVAVPQLRFLGEQDGPAEHDLKERLTELFRRHQSVHAAYLARVSYEDQSPIGVALCLRIQSGPDRGMAERIGQIFASMFGAHEQMDIIFLTDIQETDVAKVCQPFFFVST